MRIVGPPRAAGGFFFAAGFHRHARLWEPSPSAVRFNRMFNRWLGLGSLIAMLTANLALVWQEFLPGWLAGDPPPSEAALLAPGEDRFAQVGLYDAAGRSLGQSWTRSRCTGVGGIVQVYTTTLLRPAHLPGGVATPRIRIEAELTYRQDNARLDDLDFRVYGLAWPLMLQGEAMPSGEFPCEWQAGTQRGSVILDAHAPAALGDVLRPFDRLPDLYVGRTWRLNLLDPLAHLVPGAREAGFVPEPILIEVTGRETIAHDGAEVATHVVEGGGVTAWVAHDGTVLRQRAVLPLLGELHVVAEPYDEQARRAALEAVPTDWTPHDRRWQER